MIIAQESIAISNTAKSFSDFTKSATIKGKATSFLLQAGLGGNVRVTFDGSTTATNAVGLRLLSAGMPPMEVLKEDVLRISFIRETNDSTLEVGYVAGNSF